MSGTTTKNIECNLYTDNERNALMQALINIAKKEYGVALDIEDAIYFYVENTPKTSLISELVDELHRLGHRILPVTEDKAQCADCAKPYKEFNLDTVLPNDQWKLIAPNKEHGTGILCANCMVKRASKIPGVVVARMRLEYCDDLNRQPKL